MSVRAFKEYAAETQKALSEYEKKFSADFPAYHYEYCLSENEFESKIIEVISDCLAKGQDVYALGYLDLFDDVIY